MDKSALIVRAVATEKELQTSFDLRWQVLRAPWQQPRGSEQDENEGNAYHVIALLNQVELVGVGRIHRNADQQAQIRYMAVLPAYQNSGIGSAILQALEAKAHEWRVASIVLNARENVRDFYQSHQYQITGPAPTLFDSIDHVKMEKSL